MIKQTFKINHLLSFAAIACLAVGCSSQDSMDHNESATAAQPIKVEVERNSYTAQGQDILQKLVPSRGDRALMHMLNRMRVSPKKWGIGSTNDGIIANGGDPLDPKLPLVGIPGSIPAARWWIHHRRQFSYMDDGPTCSCQADPKGNPGQETRACCDLEVTQDGLLQCKGEFIECSTPKPTKSEPNPKVEKSREPAFRLQHLSHSPARVTAAGSLATAADSTSFVDIDGLSLSKSFPWGAWPEKGVEEKVNNTAAWNSFLPGLAFSPTGEFLSVHTDFTPGYETPTEKQDNCLFPSTPCHFWGGTCKTPEGEENCNLVDENGLPTANKDTAFCRGICHVEGSDPGKVNGTACFVPREGQDHCPLGEDRSKVRWDLLIVEGARGAGDKSDRSVLSDGVALRFESTGTDKPFGTTPDQKTTFSVIYNHRTKPEKVQVVIDGKCHDLEQWTDQDPMPDYSTSELSSSIQTKDIDGLSDDCHNYYFVARDEGGVVYTYPEFGSFGVQTKGGNIEFEKMADDVFPKEGRCNSYYSDKRTAATEASCIEKESKSLKVCSDNETRSCYSGDRSNLGQGVCKAGTEKCVNGQWSGVCEDEVLPQLYEVCGNDVDENCNARLDEGCPLYTLIEVPDPNANASGGGSGSSSGTGSSQTEKKKNSCSSTGDAGSGVLALLGALLGAIVLRRRKE